MHNARLDGRVSQASAEVHVHIDRLPIETVPVCCVRTLGWNIWKAELLSTNHASTWRVQENDR